MEVLGITVGIIIITNTLICVDGLEYDTFPHVLEKLSDFYRNDKVFTSPGLVYGTCDQTELKARERRCSLALETRSPLNMDEHLRLCNITFKAPTQNGKIGLDISFYALEGEKALFKWSNENNRDRYAIVDFINCSVVYANVGDLDIQSSYVAAADNKTIDIIVQNTKGPRCRFADSLVSCKLTLDFEGNIVGKLQEWLKTPYNFTALVRSPSKGHLAVDYTGSTNRTLRVYSVSDDGKTNIIKELPAIDDRLEKSIEVSTTYELLTVCYMIDVNVSCVQFDLDGNEKCDIMLRPADRLHSIKVHNLPEGGFVVLTTDCSERDKEKCVAYYRSSYIWKFDAQGEFIGYIGIGGFECPGGGFIMKTQHFFVNDQKKLCFSDLCPCVRFDKQLLLQLVCLDPIEFV